MRLELHQVIFEEVLLSLGFESDLIDNLNDRYRVPSDRHRTAVLPQQTTGNTADDRWGRPPVQPDSSKSFSILHW